MQPYEYIAVLVYRILLAVFFIGGSVYLVVAHGWNVWIIVCGVALFVVTHDAAEKKKTLS